MTIYVLIEIAAEQLNLLTAAGLVLIPDPTAVVITDQIVSISYTAIIDQDILRSATDDFVYRLDSRTITIDSKSICLSPIQTQLLSLLVRHYGRPLSAEYLAHQLYGTNNRVGLHNHIYRLRLKIKAQRILFDHGHYSLIL